MGVSSKKGRGVGVPSKKGEVWVFQARQGGTWRWVSRCFKKAGRHGSDWEGASRKKGTERSVPVRVTLHHSTTTTTTTKQRKNEEKKERKKKQRSWQAAGRHRRVIHTPQRNTHRRHNAKKRGLKRAG